MASALGLHFCIPEQHMQPCLTSTPLPHKHFQVICVICNECNIAEPVWSSPSPQFSMVWGDCSGVKLKCCCIHLKAKNRKATESWTCTNWLMALQERPGMKQKKVNKHRKGWIERIEESEGGRGRGRERMSKQAGKGERGPYWAVAVEWIYLSCSLSSESPEWE